jgi:hypothetical protein
VDLLIAALDGGARPLTAVLGLARELVEADSPAAFASVLVSRSP